MSGPRRVKAISGKTALTTASEIQASKGMRGPQPGEESCPL
jgi:hypothetical protein